MTKPKITLSELPEAFLMQAVAALVSGWAATEVSEGRDPNLDNFIEYIDELDLKPPGDDEGDPLSESELEQIEQFLVQEDAYFHLASSGG